MICSGCGRVMICRGCGRVMICRGCGRVMICRGEVHGIIDDTHVIVGSYL